MKTLMLSIGFILGLYSPASSNNTPDTNPQDSAEFLDVVLDIAFIVYDVADLGYQAITGGDVTTSTIALGADCSFAMIPFVTGGGMAVRGAKAIDELAVIANASQKSTRIVRFTWKRQSYEAFRTKALAFHGSKSTQANKTKFWFHSESEFDDMMADALIAMQNGSGHAISHYSVKYGSDAVHAIVKLPAEKYGKDCFIKVALNNQDEWLGTVYPLTKEFAEKGIQMFKSGTYKIF